jgi:acyl carrier protein
MTENNLQIEQDLFEYIGKSTHVDNKKVNANTMLFKEGIFDSMGFVLLVDFLEEKYGIKAADDDLIEENFESISAIAGFIQRKKPSYAA